MTNLRVSEESTSSFRVSWEAASGPVVRYRLTYVPVQGDSGLLETATDGPDTTIVLQQLYPVTTYHVSVAAEYPSGVGPQMQIDGTTKEGDWNNLHTSPPKYYVRLRAGCHEIMNSFYCNFLTILSEKMPVQVYIYFLLD